MVIPIAVSSWDMLLLELGFLLNRYSHRALSEDGACSLLGFFMHLSPPISGYTPRGQLSISKHLYLEYTPLCQHLFQTKDLFPWCDWYNQLLASRNQPLLQGTQND